MDIQRYISQKFAGESVDIFPEVKTTLESRLDFTKEWHKQFIRFLKINYNPFHSKLNTNMLQMFNTYVKVELRDFKDFGINSHWEKFFRHLLFWPSGFEDFISTWSEMNLNILIEYSHFNKLDPFPCNIFSIISNLIYRVLGFTAVVPSKLIFDTIMNR